MGALRSWRWHGHRRRRVRRGLRAILVLLGLLGALAPADRAASADDSTVVAEYHPAQVLVAFAPGVTAETRSLVHSLNGGVVATTLDWIAMDVVLLPAGLDPLAAAAHYEEDPDVLYAHPNWVARLQNDPPLPNDTLFDQQWGLHNTGQGVIGRNDLRVKPVVDADIDAPEGWVAAFGAGQFPATGGTRVGVLDTGIDLTHVDLLGKTRVCAQATTTLGVVVEGVCSDSYFHGTHVAGTIAAITNNGIGVAGVAPNAELAVFKALNAETSHIGHDDELLNTPDRLYYADVIAGIHWLHTRGGAQVINISIAGPQADALELELAEASAAGALLIAANGDLDGLTSDDPAPYYFNYPAAHPDVVAVSGADQRDGWDWFSLCNDWINIAAPSTGIWSTAPGNTYAVLSGTSMAAAHASGVAAMIWWKHPTWSAAQVRAQLTGAVDEVPFHFCPGEGRVNLAKALSSTITPPPPPPGAIGGRVHDARTSAGIGGAHVSCSPSVWAVTAADGSYAITGVAPATYICTVSASGYRSKSQVVTVTSNTTTTADFALRATK